MADVSAEVAVTREQLDAALGRARAGGSTVALVPTMGALHEAHSALVRRAAELADVVVVSVFVNPLQFAPTEDLARYPRSLDADVALVSEAGARVVFAPTVDDVYPGGDPQVTVHAGPVGELLEGASRPGHFDGVLTVVLKLFGMVRPDVAVFGRKDAQQLFLVRRMVRDLDVPVRIEPIATVRAGTGLALSSRNRYLDADGLEHAIALSRALAAGRSLAATGAGPAAVVAATSAVLSDALDVTADYCAVVDPESFAFIDGESAGASRDALLLVAARVGTTRLIDNTTVVLAAGGPA